MAGYIKNGSRIKKNNDEVVDYFRKLSAFVFSYGVPVVAIVVVAIVVISIVVVAIVVDAIVAHFICGPWRRLQRNCLLLELRPADSKLR